MIPKQITIGITRAVRHRRYVTSHVECRVTVDIEQEENFSEVVDDLASDVSYIVGSLEEEERKVYARATESK